MTVPWMTNCPHNNLDWCLECVSALGKEFSELRIKYQELNLRNEVLERVLREHHNDLIGLTENFRSRANMMESLKLPNNDYAVKVVYSIDGQPQNISGLIKLVSGQSTNWHEGLDEQGDQVLMFHGPFLEEQARKICNDIQTIFRVKEVAYIKF